MELTIPFLFVPSLSMSTLPVSIAFPGFPSYLVRRACVSLLHADRRMFMDGTRRHALPQ